MRMQRRWIPAGGRGKHFQKNGAQGDVNGGYVEPQVPKKDLIITCMAGCYFYTGGWAAACLRQRPVEPAIMVQ